MFTFMTIFSLKRFIAYGNQQMSFTKKVKDLPFVKAGMKHLTAMTRAENISNIHDEGCFLNKTL